ESHFKKGLLSSSCGEHSVASVEKLDCDLKNFPLRSRRLGVAESRFYKEWIRQTHS
ncbi:hypothetical protein STEG23_025387, partial [Scotinomys teguina]